ncbi:hypothetical protein BIFADO_01106 [Bifidobacterium adolescentis L2-32]|uniref:Uncharacterized protein n=1 Tax=Bifidobacterium adolescentis L2-32 TaxID=411481 RepID=A7A5I7_BIFAD|nr:hypothetical protein BIFADO_01106 [Bifidobacterium adolescentis L2-32]
MAFKIDNKIKGYRVVPPEDLAKDAVRLCCRRERARRAG